ncbi:MAG: tRNA (adenosine(37)-N6)-threonylcarbamoyltransferase complex dimerization subunit type 1 TsaB [Cellvibrionales bacterium TMED148]|nr:MAG: tRNA (adenosine(37)-N6)-threonylcarbamoyltransferase complex dimerization subunit type 1 TsaB [Cellvibrionales bacterium TMED148]
MSIMLAVETATRPCSVAFRANEKIYSLCSEDERSSSQKALQMIDEVLHEAGASINAVESLGVTVGPGSFTGLRIGFSLIQGLAFALDLPVCGLSTLEVLAATYKRIIGLKNNQLLITVIDARMGQFAVGGYLWNQSRFRTEFEDCLLGREDVKDLVKTQKPIAVAGEGTKLFPEGSKKNWDVIDLFPSAIDICELANEYEKRNLLTSISDLDLRYLRGPEAWTKIKKG